MITWVGEAIRFPSRVLLTVCWHESTKCITFHSLERYQQLKNLETEQEQTISFPMWED